MQCASLSISGLHDEFQRMRAGGLYWLACERMGDADALCAQSFAALREAERCALIVVGRSPASLLEAVRPEAGPAQTWMLQLGDEQAQAAFAQLPAELDRAMQPAPSVCVMVAPAEALSGLSDARLRRACTALRKWCRQRQCAFLLLTHGGSAALAPRLLPMNECFAGLAQLYPDHGALRYLLHYWMNDLGVCAAREFELTGDGRERPLALQAEAQPLPFNGGSGDRFMYLCHDQVLEGAPALSPEWKLYDGWATLVKHAAQAQASSVLFAIHGNSQVDELAQILHRLRRERGNALKLVIREMAPCLRYADERLLLGCGATLIVPHGTPLARFLTLLESIQGHAWQGTLPANLEEAVRAYRPPPVRGVVAPAHFLELARSIEGSMTGNSLENAMLALQPVSGLLPEQTLSQCVIRRQGDLACVYQGRVYLFLFACRRDGIERALDNLFRLPWREMFAGYERVSEYDLVGMRGFERMPDAGKVVALAHGATLSGQREAEAAARPALQPRPVRLQAGSPAP